ncbi:MAG: hypothetical protein Q7R80_04315 [bacterium]|nr:hypothetical protein [bacterium]
MQRNASTFVLDFLTASRCGNLLERAVPTPINPAQEIADGDLIRVLREAIDHYRTERRGKQGAPLVWDFKRRTASEWTAEVAANMLQDLVNAYVRVWWEDPDTQMQMYAVDAHAGTLMQAGDMFRNHAVLAFIHALLGHQPNFATAIRAVEAAHPSTPTLAVAAH